MPAIFFKGLYILLKNVPFFPPFGALVVFKNSFYLVHMKMDDVLDDMTSGKCIVDFFDQKGGKNYLKRMFFFSL